MVGEIYNNQIASTGFCVMRSNGRIDSRLLFYFVRSDSFINKLNEFQRGISYPAVKTSDVLDQPIPLPLLAEQRRIVTKLDALLGKLRQARALLQDARDTFATRRAALLHKAFTGELTAPWRAEHPEVENGFNQIELFLKEPYVLPKTWKWVKFEDVTINYDGKRVPVKQANREKMAKLYPYYGATEIIDFVDNYLFEGNYLLMGEDGANLLSRAKDNAFLATGKFWVNNHAHIVQAIDSIPLEYVMNYMNSIDLRPFITGTAQPKLTQANLNKIPLPLPPLTEQHEIVRRLESLLTYETEAAGLLDLDEQLDLLEKSILARAFRGELGTHDPADVPVFE